MSQQPKFGLSSALTTPFDEGGRIDLAMMVAHAKSCIAAGCDGVTLFGTTGEGASISRPERDAVLAAMLGGGIPAGQIVSGIVATSQGDAVDQIRVSLEAGCRNVMLPPPFYFKNPTDEGLFDWYAGIFASLGRAARNVILYHIPSVTAVPLSVDLIVRLATEFPGVVYGVKDSGGDWSFTEALLAARGSLQILVGDERHLARAVRQGGSGAISGMGNVCAARVRAMAVDGRDDPAVCELVEALVQGPVTPAVKALVTHRTGEIRWLRTRAPLLTTPASVQAELIAIHDRVFPEARRTEARISA